MTQSSHVHLTTSGSAKVLRAVMKKNIQTSNSSNDVFTNSVNIFHHRYYNFNKRILCIIGQWPYQSELERRVKFFILSLLSFSVMVAQVRAMILTWGQLDKFMACFSPLGTHIACDMKLLNIMLHQRQLRSLLDKTRRDWESVRKLKQVDMINECAEKGRRWSILWFLTLYVLLYGWLCFSIVLKTWSALNPSNYSLTTLDVIPVDYGIDPEKYWWPIQMYIWFCMTTIILIMPAFDTLYMILAQHVCGMFKIFRYNLDNMLEDNKKIDVVLKPDYHVDIYYKEIVACIKKHKYLMKYIKDIESTYAICTFIMLGLNVAGLSITSYQAVAKDMPFADAVRYTLFTICILGHIFIVTIPGHWIMSSSAFFPDSAYNCKWYMMSLRSRKLIMLLIRASIEPCTLTAGKIYVMSIQNFCAVLRTSMSYLTMLISMQ